MTNIPDPIATLVTRWRSDPYAFGSYSFLAKGSTPDDRVTLGRADPSGHLFFAGEAVSQKYPATVHGALLSGRQAAGEIIATDAKTVTIVRAGAAGLAAALILFGFGALAHVTTPYLMVLTLRLGPI